MHYGRRSIRLPGYDYTQPGYYFVTICVQGGDCLFGKIINGVLYINEYGLVVSNCWTWLGKQHPYIKLDNYVLMPNHLHRIICIKNKNFLDKRCRGGLRTAPTSHTI